MASDTTINQAKQSGKKVVSYSQYKTYKACPLSYKYKYIDKLSVKEKTIPLIFGTAIHDTIQSYLYSIYNPKEFAEDVYVNDIHINQYATCDKKGKCKDFDMETMLKDRLRYETQQIPDEYKGKWVTKEQLVEHLSDGIEIIKFLKKKPSKWFRTRGMELIGIEVPVEEHITDDLKFIGYIDVLLKDVEDTYYVIDLKTSTKGWKDYHKKDKHLTNQNLIYKHHISKQFNVPIEDVEAEYIILKRKINEQAEFAVMKQRMQSFKPAQSKRTVKQAVEDFNQFVDEALLSKTSKFEPNPTKFNCTYCEFYKRGICTSHYFVK